MRGNGSGGECVREWNGMWAELVASENVAHMNQDLWCGSPCFGEQRSQGLKGTATENECLKKFRQL